jgi:RNA polymerase sigma-70 factor (ECF subfamily)
MKNMIATLDSFKETALPHLDTLYQTALWLAKDKEKAEDLVMDVYFTAFRLWQGSVSPNNNSKAELFKIMIRLYFNGFSRNPYQNHQPHNGNGNDEFFDDNQISRAFASLPIDIRMMMTMLLTGKFTYAEIADIVGIRRKTVELMIYRGHKMLQKQIVKLTQPGMDMN